MEIDKVKIHMYYMTSHVMACGIDDSEDNLIYTTEEKYVTCENCKKVLENRGY